VRSCSGSATTARDGTAASTSARKAERGGTAVFSRSMATTGFNHVSVCAQDIDESARFYEDVFGMERIPTPRFGFPVQWLRNGDLQLHLFERGEGAPGRAYHHFGLNVDDFEELYLRAKELGIFDAETFGWHFYELPGGC